MTRAAIGLVLASALIGCTAEAGESDGADPSAAPEERLPLRWEREEIIEATGPREWTVEGDRAGDCRFELVAEVDEFEPDGAADTHSYERSRSREALDYRVGGGGAIEVAIELWRQSHETRIAGDRTIEITTSWYLEYTETDGVATCRFDPDAEPVPCSTEMRDIAVRQLESRGCAAAARLAV